jgi:glucose 1-dehydrogenase
MPKQSQPQPTKSPLPVAPIFSQPSGNKLKAQVAIVTGAAQGIGAAIAERFLREGAQVLLVDRDPAALRQQLKAMSASHAVSRTARKAPSNTTGIANAKSLTLDVTSAGAGSKALKACIRAFGRCDILVNNAGITHAASFLDLKEEDFDRVLNTNLKSYFVFGQALAKYWVASKQAGVVVNMSSVNAILAIPDQIPYVVSKGAVNQLTKVMAIALAPYDIRVNAIGPGTIATELARKAVMSSEAGRQKIMARTPLKRLGEPSEIASVALFLACQDSSYMTGQTIYPDGGRLALNYTVAID